MSLSQVKAENPNVSIPKSPTDEQLNPLGYANVFATQKPEYDAETQYLEEDAPIYSIDKWIQVWSIIDYTQQELDDKQSVKDTNVQFDMLNQGQQMTLDDDARTSVGSSAIIVDRPSHDAWMQQLYSDTDGDVINTPKPPPDERQSYVLTGEDEDQFTFTRYQDQWGYRWRMDLVKQDITNLALYIQNSQGGYLYTTGALLDNGNGGWYTECPAGQADPTPEDVYFHWILGAGRISSDFKYAGADESLSGIVRSDSDYD